MPFTFDNPESDKPILVPAIKGGDGTVTPGTLGDHHDDIDASGQRGFVDSQGNFLNRKDASKVAQDAGLDVPDNLHSEHLNKALGVPEKTAGKFVFDDEKPASERMSVSQWISTQGSKVIKGFGKDIAKPASEAWESLKKDLQASTDLKDKPTGFWDAQKKEFDRFIATGKSVKDAAELVLSPFTGALNATAGRAVSEGMNALTRGIDSAVGIKNGPRMSSEEAGGILSMVAPGKFATPTSLNANALASVRPGFTEARKAGYVVHPIEASDKPGAVANSLASLGGKMKTEQLASTKNQVVTNAIATKELGLPEGTVLDDAAFSKVRADAGKAYQAVKDAFPDRPEYVKTAGKNGPVYVWQGPQKLEMGKEYQDGLKAIEDNFTKLSADVPSLGKQKVEAFINEAKKTKDLSLDQVIEASKQYRFDAKENLKALGDPEKRAIGMAQRQVADLLETMTENELGKMGVPGLVDKYKQARTLIAKSHDVEAATDSAGNVDARKISAMANKGKPFTGGLKTVADTADQFPRDMRNPKTFGGHEGVGITDIGAALLNTSKTMLGAVLGRPLARSAALSEGIQNRLAGLRQPSHVGKNIGGMNSMLSLGRQGQGNPLALPQGSPVPQQNALAPMIPPPQQ